MKNRTLRVEGFEKVPPIRPIKDVALDEFPSAARREKYLLTYITAAVAKTSMPTAPNYSSSFSDNEKLSTSLLEQT